ncbi:hypothetical protein KR018_001101, partial [Drosophila ironensis]
LSTDQGTQTDTLLITEKEPLLDDGAHKTPLCKSASFSCSPTTSPGSSSLGSATSTISLRSSTPVKSNGNHLESGTNRALRSDTINTFQKWETTIESISYVSSKPLSISDFSQERQLRGEQTGKQV